MTAQFYLRYAGRALQRGGQRTILALLCVAFGVMSLVAMQLLAGLIRGAMMGDPRMMTGGDGLVSVRETGALTAANLATLDRLRADGTISNYSPIARQDMYMLKPGNSNPVYLLTHPPRGVDPTTFPLVGSIPLRAPAGQTFAAAIAQPLHAVITRDLADGLGLKPGDHFTLIGSPDGSAPALTVAGVANEMPDAQGDAVLYSLDTARQLAHTTLVADAAAVTWPGGDAVPAQLAAGGLPVISAAEQARRMGGNAAPVFDFMLKGAGILGLIVGGIGVANTLQVSLARRRLEIATLKTLGYQRRDLLALFGVETALLGVIGGGIGALAGIALAAGLVQLLAGSGLFLLPWRVDWRIVAGGVLTGMLTAVIFGLFTIVRASSVRPAVLLRNLPARGGWGTRLAGAALLVVLIALFTAVASVVMGSPLDGVEIIGAAIAALIVLVLLLGGTLLVLLRIPAPRLPTLTLARQNLKRQSLRAAFPLIALFMGVFTIGFATGTILHAFHLSGAASGQAPSDSSALTIYARQRDSDAVTRQLAGAGANTIHSSTRVAVTARTGNGTSVPPVRYLDGRTPADGAWDVQLGAGQWTGAPGDAVLPAALQAAPWSLHIGDTLAVAVEGQAPITLRIAGFYTAPSAGNIMAAALQPAPDVLVSQATAVRLGGPDTPATFLATMPTARLAQAEPGIAAALPQAIVVSQADVNDALQRRFVNLLAFVNGVAGLALVAGAVLIANAVGLAMVERRRELGILKAMGFTAARVLRMLAMENALLGLLAGTLGMVTVAIAMAGIDILQPGADLSLDPVLAVAMIGVSVLLALGTTALVAWQPVHTRPLDVLRNE
jgi:putative ABC transport system permease protein